jgi:hypothetical protein
MSKETNMKPSLALLLLLLLFLHQKMDMTFHHVSGKKKIICQDPDSWGEGFVNGSSQKFLV